MNSLEQVLYDLLKPMVEDPSSLSIKEMPGINENEIVLMVYAKTEDTARLIGKKGSMASAVRHMMSVPARMDNKKVMIKFESY